MYWRNIVKLHGVPKAIHSDRGPQFIGAVWRGLVVTYRNQSEIRDSVSPSKPRPGGEDELNR